GRRRDEALTGLGGAPRSSAGAELPEHGEEAPAGVAGRFRIRPAPPGESPGRTGYNQESFHRKEQSKTMTVRTQLKDFCEFENDRVKSVDFSRLFLLTREANVPATIVKGGLRLVESRPRTVGQSLSLW